MQIKCRKWLRAVCILATSFLVSLVGIFLVPCKTEAATEYELVELFSGYEKPVKNGDYYFKYEYDSNEGNSIWLISKNKKSGYKKTPLGWEFCSNGDQAYYVRTTQDGQKSSIYKYIFETGSETLVKTLPSISDVMNDWRISFIFDGKIYLNHGNYNEYFNKEGGRIMI